MIAGDAEHAIAAREATGSYRVLQRLLPCVHSELRALSGLRLVPLHRGFDWLVWA